VAKILVADDNSNVQKTVALALSELGVDVVSVNNGDAAVRKLADISPDLVLADIFMPVRNGYEVCEYIKKDSRFSHVPVVLLVGAFDPLDEREAQRVGADGILKKPFVPPDPLITMVKTLLERSGADRLVAVAASKPAISLQAKTGSVATSVQTPPAKVAPDESHEESPAEEFQAPVDRVSFGEGEHPMAFEQLLEPPGKNAAGAGTGVIEPVDDEQVLTSSRDAALGDPIFWKAEEADSQTEKENADGETDISPSLPAGAWKPGEEIKPIQVETESDVVQPIEPFELVRDQEDDGNTTVVETSILQDAASQASLNVEPGKPEDLAANPIEWMATAPSLPVEETPEAVPEWAAAVTDDAVTDDDDESHKEQPVNLESVPQSAALEPSASVALPASEPSLTPAPPPEVPKFALPTDLEAKIAIEIQNTLKAQSSLKPADQSAEDTARSIPTKNWADLAASLQFKPIEFGLEKSKSAPATDGHIPAATPSNGQAAPTISSPAAPPDPALVEAIVQRILDKMRPQVVDIITKEFLRPIVQALVHREIEK
jgi:CheY-like chemotaxis protein